MMNEIIAILVIVCVVLSIGIIGTMYALLRITRLYAAHKARLRLSEAELHEQLIGMTKEQELNTLLYELLLDLVSTKGDINLQYKLTDLSAILTAIEIRSDSAVSITGMKQTSRIMAQLKEVLETYNGLSVLEDSTRTAYEKFSDMMTQLELDNALVMKETDLAMNAYASNAEYRDAVQTIEHTRSEESIRRAKDHNRRERETLMLISSARAQKIFNESDNIGIHNDNAVSHANVAAQDEGLPDSEA